MAPNVSSYSVMTLSSCRQSLSAIQPRLNNPEAFLGAGPVHAGDNLDALLFGCDYSSFGTQMGLMTA